MTIARQPNTNITVAGSTVHNADSFPARLVRYASLPSLQAPIASCQAVHTHLAALRKKTGLDYSEMLFFDDDPTNIRDVSSIGVVSILTPRERDEAGLITSALHDVRWTVTHDEDDPHLDEPCEPTRALDEEGRIHMHLQGHAGDFCASRVRLQSIMVMTWFAEPSEGVDVKK